MTDREKLDMRDVIAKLVTGTKQGKYTWKWLGENKTVEGYSICRNGVDIYIFRGVTSHGHAIRVYNQNELVVSFDKDDIEDLNTTLLRDDLEKLYDVVERNSRSSYIKSYIDLFMGDD